MEPGRYGSRISEKDAACESFKPKLVRPRPSLLQTMAGTAEPPSAQPARRSRPAPATPAREDGLQDLSPEELDLAALEAQAEAAEARARALEARARLARARAEGQRNEGTQPPGAHGEGEKG